MISCGRASKTYPQFASAPTIESPHAYPKPMRFTRIPHDFRARGVQVEESGAHYQSVNFFRHLQPPEGRTALAQVTFFGTSDAPDNEAWRATFSRCL